jgi:hypothetical protein
MGTMVLRRRHHRMTGMVAAGAVVGVVRATAAAVAAVAVAMEVGTEMDMGRGTGTATTRNLLRMNGLGNWLQSRSTSLTTGT